MAGHVSDDAGTAALLRAIPAAKALLADKRHDADWPRDALAGAEGLAQTQADLFQKQPYHLPGGDTYDNIISIVDENFCLPARTNCCSNFRQSIIVFLLPALIRHVTRNMSRSSAIIIIIRRRFHFRGSYRIYGIS
jgi:hypothetical protein